MGNSNWTALPDYSHEPLNGERCTRLLKLQPSTHQSSICECTIHQLNLDRPNKEPYEALSYSGSATNHQSFILIRYNQNQTARLPIPHFLEVAFRRLRSDRETRTLWVDQICINMTDNGERSRQLKLIGDIYNRASNVCIWLGEGDDNSRKALGFIQKMVQEPALYHSPSWKEPNSNLTALSILLRRPLFSRSWVVQEISLARKATVQCGESFVDWSDFADVVSLVAEQSSWPPGIESTRYNNPAAINAGPEIVEWSELGAIQLIRCVSDIVRKQKDGQIAERNFSLESLICGLSEFHCADPRDKIYAFLGISSRCDCCY